MSVSINCLPVSDLLINMPGSPVPVLQVLLGWGKLIMHYKDCLASSREEKIALVRYNKVSRISSDRGPRGKGTGSVECIMRTRLVRGH